MCFSICLQFSYRVSFTVFVMLCQFTFFRVASHPTTVACTLELFRSTAMARVMDGVARTFRDCGMLRFIDVVGVKNVKLTGRSLLIFSADVAGSESMTSSATFFCVGDYWN